nr:DNA-binding protein RFX5-like isoform X1 [Nerophis lumbriciformis]
MLRPIKIIPFRKIFAINEWSRAGFWYPDGACEHWLAFPHVGGATSPEWRCLPAGGGRSGGGGGRDGAQHAVAEAQDQHLSVQTKVDQILQDVQRFSDNDKLYLYLQLPSGLGAGDKSGGDCSFTTSEQLHTCNWIRSHLEEHSDTCLPKQDVYETYKRYCDNLQHHPLSAANFGKIIRDIFPNIKARRLGGRGQSKYCYSGIRRKMVLNMPLLPNLDLKNDPAELTELVQTYKQEVTDAACKLICDWAQKILKRSFDTVVEIAHYLMDEHLVNPRCSQAELVASATLAGGPAKPHKVIKRTPLAPKCDSDTADHKRDGGDTASSLAGKLPASDKGPSKGLSQEAPPSPAASSLRPAVEAYMKQLPRILPRSSIPEKGQLMIVPQGCLSYETRESANKRPLEVTSGTSFGGSGGLAALPVKRKRGRPRKPRPEDTLPKHSLPPQPPPPPAAPPHSPVIASVKGGVIHKASSAPVSQSVLELVIQEPPGLVLSPVPITSDTGPRLVEHRGVVVQCQAGGNSEPDRHTRPLLLFQSPGNAGWETATPGRTRTMVEVIQKTPRPNNNNSGTTLPPPRLQQERGEVEITLTPVEVSVPPPDCPSASVKQQQKQEEEGPSP